MKVVFKLQICSILILQKSFTEIFFFGVVPRTDTWSSIGKFENTKNLSMEFKVFFIIFEGIICHNLHVNMIDDILRNILQKNCILLDMGRFPN